MRCQPTSTDLHRTAAAMTTEMKPLVGAALVSSALVVGIAALAALSAGASGLRGSLIGGVLAVSVFLVGTFTVNVVSGLVPALSLLVAMLTYVLQVVVMALVVLALVRSGFGGQQEFRQWFAGSVIAVTMVWMSVQVWLFTRQRIPAYAPSDHGEPGGEA